MASVLDILLLLTTFLAFGHAHNIQMKAHSRECFHESLHKDDKMTVTFQVGDREFGGSGNLDIDFWVCQNGARIRQEDSLRRSYGQKGALIQDPTGAYTTNQRTVSSGDHSFEAHQDGKFTYCFSNEHWSANTKEVSFNVHGIVYVPEHEAPQDPLEKEVRQLSELLAQVKDEQGYIVVRERTHRNTAESTNARVKWWSLFQLGVLAGEVFFQVWFIRRFFEVKGGQNTNKGALG
ncbi:p24 complex component [Elasticomyces elasticus]|nr:p24 complex component [Elasticomyces elasticus]